ncbi:unnamed protein product, partial [Amaranthus hypochondriacus]
MGDGDFILIFNEGRDDELLALVKSISKPPLYQQNSAYPSIPMTKNPPKQQFSGTRTLTPSTLATKCIEDTRCEDSGVNEEIEDKTYLKCKGQIKGLCETGITVHEEKLLEEDPNVVKKDKSVQIMKKKERVRNRMKIGMALETKEIKKKAGKEKKKKTEEKGRRKKTKQNKTTKNSKGTIKCGGAWEDVRHAWRRAVQLSLKFTPRKTKKRKAREILGFWE